MLELISTLNSSNEARFKHIFANTFQKTLHTDVHRLQSV